MNEDGNVDGLCNRWTPFGPCLMPIRTPAMDREQVAQSLAFTTEHARAEDRFRATEATVIHAARGGHSEGDLDMREA